MAETIKGFTIELDLDHLSVDRGLKGLKDNLKTVNSEMKNNMSAFDFGEKSTKKYETSLMGLNKKLEVQKKVVAAAKDEYEKMVAEHGKGSAQAEKAAREYNNQAAALNNLERYIAKTKAELAEFEKQQRIANSSWTKVGDVLHSTGDKLIGVGKNTKEVGDKLTKNISVPLGLVGGLAIKTGSDFEAGMSRVGAISGASAEDMEKLESKAREMGATTVFSAKEASDAFYYMSLAGWDASESMDGIAGVMDLAAASGEDLASVADIVTDGLTAFGLKAKDSGRMADVLASASANANTDVRGLGQAFQYVAPVAGALGYSIEDTSKAIGLMANAGIKSTKAGTALRTMMTNLAKPTDAQAAAMKRYGISLTDSSGNMKSFDQVMMDLRQNLGKLDKQQQSQAAATIFGKEAMSGALAIVNASEEDYNKLTRAIKESEGSAKDMAETMQDNLQGSIKELQSMAEDLFITMYKNLNPALNQTVDGAKNVTQWFANLSPETQELITKMGLLAFASGPVISMTGRLTEGLGHTFKAVGDVSKAIGIVSNGGTLAAGLASLGPGAIAGIAIAGIGALAYGIHHFKSKAKEAAEVNLDLAESLSDQAFDLEKSADTFDKLSSKAKISNEELARLNDLNIKISESSNPGEIEELQRQYDALAKNSGLSKDELKSLFKANSDLIEQAPDVEQSISNEGNAFAKNTEAVREYISSLREMTRIELEAEREKQLAREVDLRKELVESQREEKEIRQGLSNMMDAYNGKVEDSQNRIDEINEKIKEINASGMEHEKIQERQNALIAERDILEAISNGKLEYARELYEENLDKMQESLSAQIETTQSKEEELAKLSEIEIALANILLKEVGINEEGEKGLQVLDETIKKNEEEIAKLGEIEAKGKELTEDEKERLSHLKDSVEKQKDIKAEIFDQYGLYKDLNSLVDDRIKSVDMVTKSKIAELAKTVDIKNLNKDILDQLDSKSKKLEKDKKQLIENKGETKLTKEEIEKQVREIDNKLSKQAEVKKEILKELGLWDDVDDAIKDGINNEIKKGEAVDSTSTKLDGQGNKIDANNQKTEIGIDKEKERTAEAGRDVDKNVDVGDGGSVDFLNRRVMEKKNKTVDVIDPNGTLNDFHRRIAEQKNKPVKATDPTNSISKIDQQASKPVTKVINFIGKGLEKLKRWADGTPPSGHPGGPAVVGDGGGRELITLPGGQSFLSPDTDTLLNLPKGTQVIDHRSTAKLLRSVPRYAEGTGGISMGSVGGTYTLANIDRLDFATPINQSLDKSMHRINLHMIKNFSYIGKESVESVAKGFSSNSVAVEMAAKEMNVRIESINKIANDRLLNTKKDLEEKKIKLEKNTLSQLDGIHKKAKKEERTLTKEELAKIEIIKKKHADNLLGLEKQVSEKIKQIEENKTRALELLPSRVTKATIGEIEKRNDYEEKSMYGQFKKWTKLQEDYIKEEKKLTKEIKKQKDIVAKAEKSKNEKQVKSRTEALNKLLEKEKENNEKLKEAESEALRYKQEIHNELNTLNNEYVSRVQEINDKLISEEKRLNEEYQQALDNRTQSYYGFAGIFDEIKEKESVAGQFLMDNLKDQVDAMVNWVAQIETLAARGINEGLLEELRAMGPKAATELAALNSLSDEQLQEYVKLWESKNALARSQAERELIGMKEDTEKQIKELHEQSEKQLDELEVAWRIKVQNIRFGVKEEFNPMTADLKEIGENSIQGMINGLSSMEGALMAKANSIASAVKRTISSAFDINSPSRWMKQYIGQNMMLGWIEGVDSKKGAILGKAKEMSGWMIPDLSSFDGLSKGSEFVRLLAINSRDKIANQTNKSTNELQEMIALLKDFIEMSKGSREINQTNYYQGVSTSSPSEITRKNKQMLRQLYHEWG